MRTRRARLGVAGFGFVLTGVIVALGLAALAGPFASTQPDGLNKVAAEHGIDGSARASATKDSPLANYAVPDVDNGPVTKALAGIIGVTITLAVAAAVFGGLGYAVRRRTGAT